MFERLEPALKIACGLLAVLFLYVAIRAFDATDPLAAIELPDLGVLDSGAGASRNAAEASAAAVPGLPRGFGGPPVGPVLPPEVQTQVDFVQHSGILGPVPQAPLLMLLGIAGDQVFLQTPTGQSGLAAPGEELGGVKVIRIGTNRVLVEVEGALQELVLFPELAGESLLPKPKDHRP